MLLTPELKRVLAGVSLFAAIAGNSPSAAKAPGGGAEGPPVTLTSEGAIVAVSNGILRATIAPSMARVVSLVFRGHEMVQTLTRQRDIYFSMSGGKTYEQPGHCIYSITHQSPDGIDISCKRIYSPDKGDKHPWDLDIHFVLRRGASGLYSYAIVRHPADYPTVGMGE